VVNTDAIQTRLAPNSIDRLRRIRERGDAYHDALARRRVTSISRAIDGDKNIFARSSVVIIRR